MEKQREAMEHEASTAVASTRNLTALRNHVCKVPQAPTTHLRQCRSSGLFYTLSPSAGAGRIGLGAATWLAS